MKASETIAIDFFIEKCLDRGIDNQYEIVEAARKEDPQKAQQVRQFLIEGRSNPYENRIDWEDCIDCGTDLLFDENAEENYCPVCEP